MRAVIFAKSSSCYWWVLYFVNVIKISISFLTFVVVISHSVTFHNNLFQIQPTLGEWRPASRKSRREQVVISRLRSGHTRLTHSFILKQEPQPQCLTSQTTCTVKHVLIECRAFAVIRKRFFKVNSLTDLFEKVKRDDILSLRETELYQKIWQLKTG